MQKLRYNKTLSQYKVGLSLIIFKEDGITLAYCPSLDLSGYGNSQSEAIKSFDIALEEFIKYTSNKKTINKVLSKMGWKHKLKDNIYTPPALNEMLKKRYLSNIINTKNFVKKEHSVMMPTI